MSASVASSPRQLLPRGERQLAILKGAATAFARAGYAATSMEEIAAASGITKLIVYRHFESKEQLYRAVLQRVSDRMAEEFIAGLTDAKGASPGLGGRTFLVVARENPNGFRLLWRHAAREPEFAGYAREWRDRAVWAARSLIADRIGDPSLHDWAAETLIGYLVEATLNWLEFGDADQDGRFIAITGRSIRSLITAYR